jgi:hypothetical protein
MTGIPFLGPGCTAVRASALINIKQNAFRTIAMEANVRAVSLAPFLGLGPRVF